MEEVTLFKHITDGGAVYWVDNHNFAEAKVIIRTDGELELLRFGIEEELMWQI